MINFHLSPINKKVRVPQIESAIYKSDIIMEKEHVGADDHFQLTHATQSVHVSSLLLGY